MIILRSLSDSNKRYSNKTSYFKILKVLSKCLQLHRQNKVIKSYNMLQLGDSWNYMPPILVPSSAKLVPTQISAIVKLNGRKDFILRSFACDIIHPWKLATEAQE